MECVILAIARFRNDQKEAMSKNFVNLANNLCQKGHHVLTVSPTTFQSQQPIEQHSFRQQSRYESLIEGLGNLVRLSIRINRLVKKTPSAKVNIHIATPIELLVLFLFIHSRYRQQTTLSIWQSYMTYDELRANRSFYLRNGFRYFHLLAFNSFITAPLYRWLLATFHQVIVHSPYQKQQLESLTRRPVSFVQNGVFPKQFQPPRVEKNKQKMALLYIGHAKPSKGVDALIELAATLKQRGKIDFELTLCLSGFGDQTSIERLVTAHGLEQHTRFKASIDVVSELAAADLLILPLRTCIGTSLTPNLIVEAVACGLPVAIPEFEQLAQVIQFGQNAVKIDLNDFTASSKAIEKCAEAGQLEHLSQGQLTKFKENFSLEEFTDGYSLALNLI